MDFIVQTSSFESTDGLVLAAGHSFPCKLGRHGVTLDKQEGDGATPIGRFPLRHIFYRPDRITRPVTNMTLTPLQKHMGWCDDPEHPDYNTLVRLPHPGCIDETLWREEDGVYDIIVVLGYNDDPIVKNKGSGIFMHVMRPEGTPTAGCVALTLPDLMALLKYCTQESTITILPPRESSTPD